MDVVLKLFLDSSVFNFNVDGKQGQKQRETQKPFAAIEAGRYETSTTVVGELEDAPKAKYDEMNDLVKRYVKKVFKPDDAANRLADRYVEKHIIPAKYRDDGLHIAVATVKNLDFVVTCNMGHMNKQKTMIGTGFINLRPGIKTSASVHQWRLSNMTREERAIQRRMTPEEKAEMRHAEKGLFRLTYG